MSCRRERTAASRSRAAGVDVTDPGLKTQHLVEATDDLAYVLDSSAPFAIAAGVVIAALFALAYRTLGRRIGQPELALGFLGLWLALAPLFAAAVPDAAYLFRGRGHLSRRPPDAAPA